MLLSLIRVSGTIRPDHKLPNTPAQHYRSVLRMPTANSDVDNFAAGGIAAGVDDNGRLKPAVGKQKGYSYMDSHPVTGGRIKGEKLFCWEEVVDLAKNTHDLVSDVYSIGWDIAWTKQGAVIIEANMGWCADLAQMAHDEPLGLEFCHLFWSAAQTRDEFPADETEATQQKDSQRIQDGKTIVAKCPFYCCYFANVISFESIKQRGQRIRVYNHSTYSRMPFSEVANHYEIHRNRTNGN